MNIKVGQKYESYDRYVQVITEVTATTITARILKILPDRASYTRSIGTTYTMPLYYFQVSVSIGFHILQKPTIKRKNNQ